MSDWKEYKLGEVCSRLRSGKNLKSNLISPEGKYPVWGGNGVRGYTDECNFKGECCIIGRQGAYCGNVHYYEGEAYMTEHAIVAVGNEQADTFYLSCALSLMHLENLSAQSAQPGISVQTLAIQTISLPPIEEQRRIAGVLGALDEKIDLLSRENATLEALAETLFRHHFIENPCCGVGSADNPTWKEGKLGELIEVKYGKDHKKLGDGDIPVIGSGGVMRYADKALFDGESVLIPRKGSLNNVMYIDEPFWTVDTMFYTKMKIPHVAKFVYQFMKTLDLVNMNVGSAVPSMTAEVLNNVPLEIPSQAALDDYDRMVTPFYKKIKSNQQQIKTLSTQRDTLLPRLMSGEATVI